MRIALTETCRDCNGTGADYDKNCRPIACRSCGGAGWVEVEGAQEEDTPSRRLHSCTKCGERVFVGFNSQWTMRGGLPIGYEHTECPQGEDTPDAEAE